MSRSAVVRTILAAVVVLGLVGAMAGPAASVDSEKLLELGLDAANGDFRAPDFGLVTVDKGQVGLSQYRGKVVVLNFWTTW